MTDYNKELLDALKLFNKELDNAESAIYEAEATIADAEAALSNARKALRPVSDDVRASSIRLVMSDYEKLEWIHCAIQEALNGVDKDVVNCSLADLNKALELVEELREPYLQEKEVLSNG
jgi:hypothetical protein|tara:strand:- start:1991 stop:2350 length:360 start_codon:yes stop_codon:yes gene_type:complete